MKIYLAGRNGLVGSAFCQYYSSLGEDFISTESSEVDLRDYNQVKLFLLQNKPDVVILSAAKHGGIESYRNHPLEYYRDNLLISLNVINGAAENGIKFLINIGASCVYADGLKGPLKENQLFLGAVQKPTEPYGFAKAAGMKLCEYYNLSNGWRYLSILPVNLYGNGIGYHLDTSTVIPAMMKRFHEAVINQKEDVSIWGTGKVKREFLHVTDLVRAVDMIIKSNYSEPYINVGYGKMFSINEIAYMLKQISGFDGTITHDLSKPDGAQRETLDCSNIISLGWQPKVDLFDGLKELYKNYCER